MIRKYLYPLRLSLALGLILKTGGALAELLLPYILAHIIDNVVPLGEIPPIYFWGFMMFLAAVAALLGNILANRRSARVASTAIRAIRSDLFTKTLALSASQINHYSEASLESRLTSDTYHVHNMISRLQRIGIRAPILLSGGLLMTFLLDWQLALILTALLPFIGGFTFWIAKRGRPKYMKQQAAADGLVRKVRETVSGIRVIKSLVTGRREKKNFAKINQQVVTLEKDAAYNMALTNPIMTLLMNMGLAFVLVGGAFLINLGRSEYGAIVAFLTYFTIITNSMVAITRIFTIYNRGMASAHRIAEVLDTTADQVWPIMDETSQEADQLEPKSDQKPPHIEFRNVSFSYASSGEEVIRQVSFRLEHGATIGILGETGSGKSTLIALLLRLYDATSGEILIDGINIQALPRETLYAKFGLSLQNDFLYGDTIRANIDFGRGLSEETIINAAKLAKAWEFIQEKADGLDMRLSSRAGNLSGGQKQRLLIARALAANPEILIFDDSSSALDYQTDADVRRMLREEYLDSTHVVVAQRISSVRAADLILLMERGRISASGTHDELMEHSEQYREIAAVQMGLISKRDDEHPESTEEKLMAASRHDKRDEEDGDLYG